MDCCNVEKSEKGEMNKPVLIGLLAGLGLLIFYVSIVSIFQGFEFALLSLRSKWFLFFPLAIGFGAQIGIFSAIRHSAQVTGTAIGTGGVSAGSMLACCSHFLFNVIPFVGFSGLAIFVTKYQDWFLVLGIVSNLFGIFIMRNHLMKMKGGKK